MQSLCPTQDCYTSPHINTVRDLEMIHWRALSFLSVLLLSTPATADLRNDWARCQSGALAEQARSGRFAEDAESQYCYGLGYAFGHFPGGKQPERAARYYSRAAESGYAGAQTTLGYAYEKGYGLPRDSGKALHWYRKAARQGNGDAMFNLGRLLERGAGGNADKTLAREWFERAAAQGNEQARQRLKTARKLQDLQANRPAVVSQLPAAPRADPLRRYLDGLEALRGGDFPAGRLAFEDALRVRGSEPRFILALGVAATLEERFDAAAQAFERYQRLRGPGREATLWWNAAKGMAGSVYPGGGPSAPRSLGGGDGGRELQCQSGGRFSVPGHLIQGSAKDYPTDYASFVIHDLGHGYVKAYCDGQLPPRGELRETMRKAGRWFAHRKLVDPDLAPAHRAKALELFDAGRHADALLYAGFARKAYPDDAGMIHLIGRAWLALGRPATARRELTVALTLDTALAAAYRDRSQVAAMLGDQARAANDLAVAAKLDRPAGGDPAQQDPGGADRQAQDIGQLQAALLQAARHGDARRTEDLARRLHQAAEAERSRYDEHYQAHLRRLQADVALFPGDPDRLVALATYLGDEARLRGESVEPRRPQVPWRWQLSEENELGRALEHLDRALGMDPEHVPALLTKALVLARLERESEAEALADRAIALAPDDPEALALYAYYKGRRANAMNARAAALRSTDCSSSTHTETRSDGVYEVRTTTCYPPTQAELALADQLDRQAEALRQRSRAAMAKAIHASAGTYRGYLLQADMALWSRDGAGAVRALKQAIALDPTNPRAQEELARVYARGGQDDLAVEQRIIADSFLHTTAAPLLKRAWRRIGQTDWEGADSDLQRAMRLDPADARAPAYLGVSLELQGDAAGASAYYRMALALEQARIERDEPADPARRQPRDAADFGLMLAMHQRLARLAGASGNVDLALDRHRAIDRISDRFAPGWRSVELFSAMLPEIPGLNAPPPEPRNTASLVAETYRSLGELYRSLGRRQEAIAAFRSATALGPTVGRPKIGSPDGGSNYAGEADEAAGDARVALAAELMKAGDYSAAQEALSGIGYGKLSEQARKEANLISRNLAKLLARRPDGDHRDRSPDQQNQARHEQQLREQERQLRRRYEGRIRTLRNRGMEEHARAEERTLEQQIQALRGVDPWQAKRQRDQERRLRSEYQEHIQRARTEGLHAKAELLERQLACGLDALGEENTQAGGGPGSAWNPLLSQGGTVSELVGTWAIAPQSQWRYMPGAGRLTLGADGSFRFRPDGGKPQRDGLWGAIQGTQIFLGGSDCRGESYYYQTLDAERLLLTREDAVTYDAIRLTGRQASP